MPVLDVLGELAIESQERFVKDEGVRAVLLAAGAALTLARAAKPRGPSPFVDPGAR